MCEEETRLYVSRLWRCPRACSASPAATLPAVTACPDTLPTPHSLQRCLTLWAAHQVNLLSNITVYESCVS
jgi:hypothetical protein